MLKQRRTHHAPRDVVPHAEREEYVPADQIAKEEEKEKKRSVSAIDFRDRPPPRNVHGFFRGRPRGRSVDSMPNRSAVLFCHRSSPNAHARCVNNGVAVGTALAGGPPHGSVREELPHTALTLGSDVRRPRGVTAPSRFVRPTNRCLAFPVLSPARVRFEWRFPWSIPFSPPNQVLNPPFPASDGSLFGLGSNESRHVVEHALKFHQRSFPC